MTIVPNPPVKTMAHLYLRADKEAFASATRTLAMEEKTWTWAGAEPTGLPDHVVVELTVGDATLEWSPQEVRDAVSGLLERARPAG